MCLINIIAVTLMSPTYGEQYAGLFDISPGRISMACINGVFGWLISFYYFMCLAAAEYLV